MKKMRKKETDDRIYEEKLFLCRRSSCVIGEFSLINFLLFRLFVVSIVCLLSFFLLLFVIVSVPSFFLMRFCCVVNSIFWLYHCDT